MPKDFFAHTVKGSKSTQDWQTLPEHRDMVAEMSGCFASAFGSHDWGWNAGVLHDLGKIAPGFQKKLYDACGIPYKISGHNKMVNHSNAGAAFAEQNLQKGIGRTLAYIIAGHHAGLPDYINPDAPKASWSDRKTKADEELDQIKEEIGPYISCLRELKSPPSFVNNKNYHLWVRMIFSCLIDADWLDTERFMEREKYDSRPKFPSLEVLREKFDVYMAGKLKDAKKSELNDLRNEILSFCRLAAQGETGLYSLTVPTGGGKTLSGMAFALDHAIKNGKNRIIYVIPYTSIIEQTAKELRLIFGNDNVIEHHSNVVRDDKNDDKNDGEDKGPEYKPSDLAAENWDAPIIVTTNVQFFESLYAARPRCCRKIHNIPNSVVIIDEAQLISPEHIAPCTDVVKHLSDSFNTSVVLCTATQARPKAFAEAKEIIPDPQKFYQALKRTKITFPGDLNETKSWEELAKELHGHEKVLCIVNTRKDCRELYAELCKLSDPGETIHLSALMCGEHRSAVIAEIKRRLDDENDKRPLRVISTQLVEAGVDIDFPVVYRAMAGLDSIVQAAGRCNREGKLKDEHERPTLGQVVVFIPENQALRGMLAKAESTTKSLIRQGKTDTDDPNLFAEYFDQFYAELNKKGEEILEWLRPGKYGDVMFRQVGEKFKLIDDGYTVPILVKFKEGEALIESLRTNGPSRDLLSKLQRYTISLDRFRAEKFLQSGVIQKLTFYGTEAEFLVQYSSGLYSEEIGFDITKSGLTDREYIVE